jgi:hypothetical protein
VTHVANPIDKLQSVHTHFTMFFQIAYILLGLSAIPDILGEDPRTAENNTANTYHEAPAESTASSSKSATLPEPHTEGDGVSPWGVDNFDKLEQQMPRFRIDLDHGRCPSGFGLADVCHTYSRLGMCEYSVDHDCKLEMLG